MLDFLSRVNVTFSKHLLVDFFFVLNHKRLNDA